MDQQWQKQRYSSQNLLQMLPPDFSVLPVRTDSNFPLVFGIDGSTSITHENILCILFPGSYLTVEIKLLSNEKTQTAHFREE